MRGLFGRFVQEDVVEDKTEYGEPGKRRLKRERYAYEEADNTKIREALKNGAELPFAVLKERGEHLVIR